MPTPIDTLRTVFGYDAFRGEQAQIIDTVVAGGDALVLMPTGGGKSLCYQIPALVRAGHRRRRLPADRPDAGPGRRAVARSASAPASSTPRRTYDERRGVEQALLAGELDLLYLAPERLRVPETLAPARARPRSPSSRSTRPTACPSGATTSGPTTSSCTSCGERWPDVPRIALTATATSRRQPRSAPDCGLDHARTFVASFDRPNISYRIVPKDNPRAQLLELLRTEHDGDAGIVYCLSRASVEQTAAFLVAQTASPRCRTTRASTRGRARPTSRDSCARTAS